MLSRTLQAAALLASSGLSCLAYADLYISPVVKQASSSNGPTAEVLTPAPINDSVVAFDRKDDSDGAALSKYGKNVPLFLAMELVVPQTEGWRVRMSDRAQELLVSWEGGDSWLDIAGAIAEQNGISLVINHRDRLIGISENHEEAIGLSQVASESTGVVASIDEAHAEPQTDVTMPSVAIVDQAQDVIAISPAITDVLANEGLVAIAEIPEIDPADPVESNVTEAISPAIVPVIPEPLPPCGGTVTFNVGMLMQNLTEALEACGYSMGDWNIGDSDYLVDFPVRAPIEIKIERGLDDVLDVARVGFGVNGVVNEVTRLVDFQRVSFGANR